MKRGEPTNIPLGGREPFRSAAAQLLRESGCVIWRWRPTTTGVAYTRSAEWYIEAPQPTTAVRFAVFAHEVGHQMLHRSNSLPRYVEEAEAWAYALLQFPRFEIELADALTHRAATSVRYSLAKANRRGAQVDESPSMVLEAALERIANHSCLAHHRPNQGAARAH